MGLVITGRGFVCRFRWALNCILLDCGLANIDPLLIQAQPPANPVLWNHAHEDYARGLLALHQVCPDLPIYGSEVIQQLLPLNWPEKQLSQKDF